LKVDSGQLKVEKAAPGIAKKNGGIRLLRRQALCLRTLLSARGAVWLYLRLKNPS